MSLKCAVYDPYFDTLGGGERYCLTVAEALLENNNSVDLFWSGDKNLIKKAEDRFNLKLSRLNIIPDIFGLRPQSLSLVEETNRPTLNNLVSSKPLPQKNLLEKLKNFATKSRITRQYDLIFYLSDGSIPFIFSRNNLFHLQVPFKQTLGVFDWIKLKFFKKIICNSDFTLKHSHFINNNRTIVLYPPVDVDKFHPDPSKENIIVSVGRFDNLLNAKRQDVLIKAFKIFYQYYPAKTWRLVLAGGSLQSEKDNSFLKHLKTLISDLPVELKVNPSFDELVSLYSKSKIYWHAAGFDVDENINPQNTEHFGITVVEAMASGAVPLVVAKGGLPEIVQNDLNGYLWNSQEELIAKTKLLVNSPKIIESLSQQAQKTSQKYSKSVFKEKFLSCLSK